MKRWALPVIAFLAMVAFWPWWESGGLIPRWAILAIGAPIAVLVLDIRMTPLHWAGLALLGWSATTVLWTPVPLAGIGELAKLLIFAACFMVAAETDDLRPTYLAIIAGVAVSGGIAIAQFLGYEGVQSLNGPAGTFINRNYLAEMGLLALIPALYLRQYWALPLVLIAAFQPMSRGVILAAGAALVVWVWTRSRAVAGLMGLGVVAMLLMPLPHSLTDNSSLTERLGVWKATVEHLTWFGYGTGSYYVEFPTFMPHPVLVHNRPAHAHNEILNAASEIGLPGVLALLLFFGIGLRYTAEMERLVLVASLVIGLFSFPLHLPASGFVVAVVAGSAAHRWRLVRGSESVGGATKRHWLARAWAGIRHAPAYYLASWRHVSARG